VQFSFVVISVGASVRFSSAFFSHFECYGDLSPIGCIVNSGSLSKIGRSGRGRLPRRKIRSHWLQ